ncbi:MAG: hypothetical protein C0515_09200 [Novosphingobium sp.]|nr:hypothetical protein [Novosphingobium sp.]MBX9642662.1 hypothetical protein [Novosphingobium sp.]
MAAWDIDLTTRAGAKTGAYQASLVCFIYAGLSLVGLVFLGGLASFQSGQINGLVFGLAVLQVAIFVIAGLRLRQGKGFFWGIGAALLLVLALLGNLAGGAIFAAGLNLLLLVFLGNGLRGAYALHRGTSFEDEDIEVFN